MPALVLVTEKIGVGSGNIKSAELTQAQAEHQAQGVEPHRVRVNRGDLAVCIDGRPGQFLGPKLAGAFKTVQAAAKAVGYHLSGKALHSHLKELGFNLGAHVDITNQQEDFVNGTGCGANDKEEAVCGNFNANAADLKSTAKSLIELNGVFNEEDYENTALSLTTQDIHELRNIVGEDSVEVLEDDGEGVHGHTEWAVYFNYVEGTTIDRDGYFAETGKKLFVVDMWYIKQLADAMAEGVDAEGQASALYHAMVAYQIGTYITLCDGSHRAIIATPEAQAT